MFGPQGIQATCHGNASAGRLPGDVVQDPVVLEPVGPSLVPSLSTPNLSRPDGLLGFFMGLRFPAIQFLTQGLHGQAHAVFSRAGLGGANQTGGMMRDSCASLDLVSVLTTRSGSGKERNVKIPSVPLSQWCEALGGLLPQDCHGYGGAVCASAPLSARNALDPMSPAFIVQARYSYARDDQAQERIAANRIRGGVWEAFQPSLSAKRK